MPHRLIPVIAVLTVFAAAFGALGGQLVAGTHRQVEAARADAVIRDAALWLRSGHYIPPSP
jgi:hypothetical protein